MISIRTAGIIKESIVDGPGIRYVLFTQGCLHHCPGCHNPDSWDMQGGYDCEIQDILQEIDSNPLLTGVTFSGGEPFEQPEALLELAKEIKRRELTLMIYTGYRLEELMQRQDPQIDALIASADTIIDGRYEQEHRTLEQAFRGSTNQRWIDVPKTLASGTIVLFE